MADNTITNLGSGGDTIRTKDRAGIKTPAMMLDLGSAGTESLVDGTAAVPAALLPVGGKIVRVSQTPTVSTSAYAAKDCMGGLLTFANSARASGGAITIEGGVVTDLSATMPSLDLLLFDQTFTAGTDNAALDVSDTDILNLVGVIPFTTWADFADNSAATRFGVGLSAKLAGTSLFGQLVTRSVVTLIGTSDITVILHIRQH
jgi:hypothetical protein